MARTDVPAHTWRARALALLVALASLAGFSAVQAGSAHAAYYGGTQSYKTVPSPSGGTCSLQAILEVSNPKWGRSWGRYTCTNRQYVSVTTYLQLWNPSTKMWTGPYNQAFKWASPATDSGWAATAFKWITPGTEGTAKPAYVRAVATSGSLVAYTDAIPIY
jgi:hypothetical protein